MILFSQFNGSLNDNISREIYHKWYQSKKDIFIVVKKVVKYILYLIQIISIIY